MRRRHLVGVALLGLFVCGGLVGAQVGGDPTVATQTFTHEDVVTYTVPTETVVATETVVSTVTVTETVSTTTEPPPTTTEPPPTTTVEEPPPDPEGTTISLVNERFVCGQDLAALATDGMPLRVDVHMSNETSRPLQNGTGRLNSGCTGASNGGQDGKIDLYLTIHGDGGALGPASDAIVVAGARNMDIVAVYDCGAPGSSGTHPDGIQFNYGHNLTFWRAESGDWERQRATCHGSGAVFYPSTVSQSPADLTDVVCRDCRIVGSTGFGAAAGRALGIYHSTDSGAIGSCFSANIPRTIGPTAVRPVDEGNLYIDRDANVPQPSPSDCRVP